MNEKQIEDIKLRWNITDAFAKALASEEDKNIWLSECSKSDFKTSFSYYTSLDKTYIEILNNVNYFTNNCSMEGLLSYISFYENQTNVKWKEI